MLWLCGRMCERKNWPTHRQIVLVTCDCVELALALPKCPNDPRPCTAIETARKWAVGKADIVEARNAARAAGAAAYTALCPADAAAALAAAHTAYYAVDAPVDAFSVIANVANAVAHATYTAYATADIVDATVDIGVAAYDVYVATRKKCADICREKLSIPCEEKK
jgi:hypothetical protein